MAKGAILKEIKNFETRAGRKQMLNGRNFFFSENIYFTLSDETNIS